jgi:tetratricopeptide (TPR) repeat protein
MKKDLNPNQPPSLADCPEQSQLRALDELLAGPAPQDEALPGQAQEDCPETGDWVWLAIGEASTETVDRLLAHASGCARCAARLRLGLHLLSQDASPQEEAEAANWVSITGAGQRSLASRLADTPLPAIRSKSAKIYLWAGAALAASLLVFGGLSVWQHTWHNPERLMAEAYSRSRIFELRIPGAGFAEVTPEAHLRGGATDRESSQLLEARAEIERNLENAPNNPHWLQLNARADILEEKFDPAIDTLDRLVAAGPVTPDLLQDDASAYFERGIATGSENDRATALDDLRRADEMAPGDPVLLFNEAVVMEDRGQLMNAVETWNRFLRFERDPRWLTAGRRHLELLEQKLNQLKTHRSRLDQRLGTPQAMRALAADSTALAAVDEELSSSLLPRLMEPSFVLPVDRSRGSPCAESCQAARSLLHALAASLERNHQDPWLTQFLPPSSSLPNPSFLQAARSLGRAIDADGAGDYSTAQQSALEARRLFHQQGNPAGEDRAEVERAYALQRLSNMGGCYRAAHPLLLRDPQFVWIQIYALTEDGICNTNPGSATSEGPSFVRADHLARDHHYPLLCIRVRNQLGGAAIESGDTEDAWRIYMKTSQIFMGGDYPPFRGYTILAGLAEVEKSTPRAHLALLLQREAMGILELTESRALIPSQRYDLAIAAIRAGFLPEAKTELAKVRSELAAYGRESSIRGFLADSEIAMANLYLERRDLADAEVTLDSAKSHMEGQDDSVLKRSYAAVRGELDLELGHSEAAEPMVRDAILEEERQARKVGATNIIFAEQNRDLYAVLAGIWQAEDRPGVEILALWERYRLRILGLPVPACPANGLACLTPKVEHALAAMPGAAQSRLFGQVVLGDRLLLYRADAQGVSWTQIPRRKQDLLAAAAALEQVVSSPATSQASVEQASRRFGELVQASDFQASPTATSGVSARLLLEPDPLLGNVSWPSVATAAGPLGIVFNLEEVPSLLLDRRPNGAHPSAGKSLVVGASIGSGEKLLLPEAIDEARDVARFGHTANLLLAGQATEPQVAARLGTAAILHFAGHAVRLDGDTRLLLAPSGAAADRPYLDSGLLRSHPPRAARLAVFSACSTGKTEEGWNHGMGDIVDTLASLGVPEVVATRWQIDSASAVPMMDAFYGGLAKGLSVPSALTAARQSLLRDPRYRHPYYWAAYYASGTGNGDLRAVLHSEK